MAYIALYRKWRPRTFRDLVGQEHVSRTLAEAIETGRIGHAYLFAGPRGTGKTSTAKILAMGLNCEHGPTPNPCGTCESCRKIREGSSMDVFEIDAASNRGIDEIRGLRETVKFAPAEGRYKVYIIDEVHMLTAEAFNALLKTLEEPPAHVVFILATTEAHKVPATIQSRCQRYDFRRITTSEIKARLRYIVDHTTMGGEDSAPVTAEDEALELIALQADGGLRDALSILDQCISLADGNITTAKVQEMLGLVGHSWIYRMTKALHEKDTQTLLSTVADLLRDGKDLRQILTELSLHLRSLMIYQAAGTVAGLDLYAEPESVLKEQADYFSAETLMAILRRLGETQSELKWSPQPRIAVEIALLAICRGELGTQSRTLLFADTGKKNGTPQPAAPNLAADEHRLAALEAKIAQLSAALAARPAITAPVIAAGATSPAAPAAVPLAQTASTSAPADASSASAAPPPAANAAISSDDLAIWQQVVASFETGHRGSTKAILRLAQFEGFRGSRCYLSFASEMLVGVAMSDLNRHYIEQALTTVFGHPMQIVCTTRAQTGSPPPAPAEQPHPRKKQPDLPPLPHAEQRVNVEIEKEGLPPEEEQNLRHSTDILGGHFIVPPDAPASPQQDAPHEAPAPAGSSASDVPAPSDADVPDEDEEDDELPPDEA